MIKITPQPLSGSLAVIASKSLSHRFLIGSALSKGRSTIKNVLVSDDITATTEALKLMGVSFKKNHIIGNPDFLAPSVIDCRESGSTLRFLIPLLMLKDQLVTIKRGTSLSSRPLSGYQEAFKVFNYTFENSNQSKLIIKGPLLAGDYRLSGNVSSQFISGLMFALPLLSQDSTITLTTHLESKGYVDLTKDTLSRFGIKINRVNNQYLIKGGQSYHPVKVKIEGDFSQAAFFMVAATIGKRIILSNLNPHSLQGDSRIIEIINQMKGRVYFKGKRLICEPRPTQGIKIDLAQIPDLGPILMVLAACSNGLSTFINFNRLITKESDRLHAMITELRKLGVKIKLTNDELKIWGQKSYPGGVSFHTYQDHRIAMALSVITIRCQNEVIIDDELVVDKSYPNFFLDFIKLGGIIT